MANVSILTKILFILTTFLTAYLFYRAARGSKGFAVFIGIWLGFTGIVAQTGFFTLTQAMPPRLILVMLPILLLVVGLFLTKGGRIFIDQLSLRKLTILHTFRIAVELILLWLFFDKAVPQVMTFEGRNFDILAGLSAPVVYHFAFIKKSLGRTGLLVWNFICLGLLFNIVITAVLSAPFPFQQLAFDQPNIAVLYFPFNWLPACIVPIVLISHLASIRILLKSKPGN
jgi:hypothetical protein